MKEILSGLYSLMEEFPWSYIGRKPEEKAAIAYIAANSIKKNDVWSVVTKTELLRHFEEDNRYIEEDLNMALMQGEMYFKQVDHVMEEIDGNNVWVPRYVPTLGIRALAKEYLDRHPEIQNAVGT